MATVLFTVFSPFASRHVLSSRFIESLLARPDLKLVYLVPQHKLIFYQKAVASYDRVTVEGVPAWSKSYKRLDRAFFSLSLHYLENKTVKIMRRAWGKDRGLRHYLVSWPLFKLFKFCPPLRELSRWLDYQLVRDSWPKPYLEHYRPDLVVATHAIYAPEQVVIREAKRAGFRTLSIVNSWDNLSVYKGVMRVLPDRLVVPNNLVKAEAIKWCDFAPNQVSVIGMWNCNYYFFNQPSPREEFCRQLGLDPGRPYVLFAAIGRNYTDTEWQDLQIIQEAINNGQLPTDLQIIVRQHPDPSSTMERGQLADQSNLVFQNSSQILGDTSAGPQNYEITERDDLAAYNAIYHAAAVITIQSTISIEACLFNRPVININFDGREDRPFYHPRGVKRYHELTHYLPVHESGGICLANSPEELIQALKCYLADPKLDQAGRQRLVAKLVGPTDGQTLERLSQIILAQI